MNAPERPWQRSEPDPIVVALTIARMARRVSQRRLAARIHWSANAVSSWENGVRTPPLEAVAAYAAALGKRLTLVDARHLGDGEG